MNLKLKSFLFAPLISGMGLLSAFTASAGDSLPVYAYVTAFSASGNDSVSIIDTVTDTVAATVEVGRGAYGVTVKPDGSRAYVVNGFDDTVSVIDGISKSVIATIPVSPSFFPIGAGVSPDGSKVYIAGTGTGELAAGHLAVIDAALNVVTAEIALPNDPSAVAVSADGSRVYVTTIHAGVFVIDAKTMQVTDTVSIPGQGSDSIALASHNPFAYVVNAPAGEIAVLNLAANRGIRSVSPGGGNVQAVAVSPDGSRCYATESQLEEVIIFDRVNRHIVKRIPVPGTNPAGISLTPDGRKAYIAANVANGQVIVIDTTSNSVLTTVSVQGAPYAKGQFIATRLPQ